MISSIEATIRFEDGKKSFVKCRDLKQINVITGENRVGKSSSLSCFPAVFSYLNDLTYPDTKKKNYTTPFFAQNMYIPNVESFSIGMDLDDGNEYNISVNNIQRKKDSFHIDSHNRNIISGTYNKPLYAAHDIHTYLYHYDIALVDSVDEHLSPSKQVDLARFLISLVILIVS